MLKTKDCDIRSLLHIELKTEFSNDEDTLIIDELGLCEGYSRVDVAVINGAIHGYEIKSERDTLDRLPGQMEVYNRVLDTVTVVTGSNHIDKIGHIIPEWWGLSLAHYNDSEQLELQPLREAKQNPDIDPYSIAQLLWKEEAIELLRRYELERGVLSKSRKIIWERLAKNLPLNELKDNVREILKTRVNWRVDYKQR